MTEVCFEGQAIERMAAWWPSAVGGPALVVMDVNTEEAAGARVLAALRTAGVQAQALVFPQRSGLRATLDAVQSVGVCLDGDRLPVAVGSGVITDVVRYAAHRQDRDFVSVPTAASMDGYASGVAALERQGVKVTYPARAPRAIFAEPAVLADAPRELTRSGLGDLLGKATAHVDWLTAHLLYAEAYDPRAAELVEGPLQFAAWHAEAVLRGERAAVRELFKGLVGSGQAMALAGSSRPASGCEHHASHFWDLLAGRGLRPHSPHGLQVGYATGFAMRIQRFAVERVLPALHRPVAVSDPLGPRALEWLGEPTEEIRSAVWEKQRFAGELGHWPGDPAACRALVGRLRPALDVFAQVQAALEAAGIPPDPGFLEIDARTLRATFRHATRLRARYTVIDLLEGQGCLEQAIEAALTPQDSAAPTSGGEREGGSAGRRRL